MKIKNVGADQTHLSQLDLLGSNEVALTRAFAWLLGKERSVLHEFLRAIGIKRLRNTAENYAQVEINTEHHRKQGRTDIEVKQAGKFHVIIEAKLGDNRVGEQKERYLDIFSPDENNAVLCLLTAVEQPISEQHGNVRVHGISWFQVKDLLSGHGFFQRPLVAEFVQFISRGNAMQQRSEILVQDLSLGYTLEQFRSCNLYRRTNSAQRPLYIAPNFTASANTPEGAGIHYLSKVLEQIQFKANDIDGFADRIQQIEGAPKELIAKWMKGFEIEEEPHKEFHYFFLDEPERLLKPITKRASRDSSKPIRNQLGLGGQIATMQQFIEWINHSYGA